jgi:rubrerythrin
MAKKLDPIELVSFKELLMANSIMADALVQLLIDKGIITQSLYEKISGESVKDGFPKYVLKKPPKTVMSGCVNVPDAVNWSKDKDASEILDFMMALEANTFDLYLKLGREVKSDRAKSVFMSLSEEEAGHLDKLSSVFEKTL